MTQEFHEFHGRNGGFSSRPDFAGRFQSRNRSQICFSLRYAPADAKSKTYGDPDTGLTYRITSGSVVNGDNFTGTLARDSGERVGAYTIRLGTLSLGSNYALTYAAADLTIGRKAASVTPNAMGKTYGDADPPLTGNLSSFLISDGVAATAITF